MDQTDSVITNINQINQEPATGTDGLNQRKRSVLQSSSTSNTNLNRDASNVSNEPPKASKRPKESRLKQQKLPAWQPILTAKTVLPLFFAVGVVFVVLGGVLLHYSNIVNEFTYDYTDCVNSTGLKCSEVANYNTNCICTIKFQLDNDFPAPVFVYYGLKNFYQNHRRYVKSRDDNQLLGRDVSTLSSECTPYAFDGGNIAPCGAIANSLFNDTFTFKYYGVSTASPATSVGLLDTGIAWTTDKNVKFRNPSSWANTVKPKNWQRPVYNLSSNPDNNGYQNEDLIVWMRTAALPTFRKLHRRVDHDQTAFKTSLPKGVYTVDINYNYPVVGFSGQKSFIISTTTWIGGKNPFLGIAYLVVGSLCILLGFCFLIIHFKFSKNKKTSEDFATNQTANANPMTNIGPSASTAPSGSNNNRH